MKNHFPYLLAAFTVTCPFILFADSSITDTRETLDKWVETSQIISKEKADWRTERAILSDTEKLLTSELARLSEDLQILETTATTAEEDRAKLTAQKSSVSEASSVVESKIVSLEAELKAIIPTLPLPLINKIKPLIRRLPEDSNNTQLSLGERVQNIVGILSQTDKFNTTITFTSESREIESGKTVEVRTLYWGLAQAYFVDASASYAGIGTPGDNGWEWQRIDSAGATIQRLLDVYEGSEAIQFVEVPARIK